MLGTPLQSSPRCNLSTHKQVCILAAVTTSMKICVTHSMWIFYVWMTTTADRRVSVCPQLRRKKRGIEGKKKGRKHWAAALEYLVACTRKEENFDVQLDKEAEKTGTAWRKESVIKQLSVCWGNQEKGDFMKGKMWINNNHRRRSIRQAVTCKDWSLIS